MPVGLPPVLSDLFLSKRLGGPLLGYEPQQTDVKDCPTRDRTRTRRDRPP